MSQDTKDNAARPSLRGFGPAAGLLLAAGGVAVTAGARLPQAPRMMAVVDHLSQPEAVSYDAALAMYFVSNVNGTPGVRDGNGFISRITADGRMDSLHFIQGGRNGVTLDAPMGSRIRGDTLWVVDVGAVRAFDARSGAALRSVDLTPLKPLFLNDLAFDGDGDIYVTDTGRPRANEPHTGPDRIYRISAHDSISVVAETPMLEQPDGIAWDPVDRRLVLAPIGGMAIQAWRPGEAVPIDLAFGAGEYDGLEIEDEGEILVTSWADSSVSTLRGERLVKLLGPLGAPPADISLDAEHDRLGVVFLTANRFELWRMSQ